MRLLLVCVMALAGCEDDPVTTTLMADGFRAPDAAVDAGPGIDAAVEARLLHVGEGASERGADGTRDHPYPTVERAYAEARAGDVVFLLPGRHGPAAPLPAGVELLGSGPEVTTLVGPLQLIGGAVAGGFAVVDEGIIVEGSARLAGIAVRQVAGACVVARADFTLTDAALSECGAEGIRIEAGVQDLGQVSITGATGAGILVVGGRANLTDIDVFNTVFDDEAGTGSGVGVVDAEASINRLRVRGGARALRVSGDAVVSASVVRSVDGENGLSVGKGAQVTVDDLVVTGAVTGAVSVIEGELSATNVQVSDAGRFGVLVSDAAADIDGLVVQGVEGRGVSFLRGTGRVTDLVVRNATAVGVQITDGDSAIEVGPGQIVGCGDSGVAVTSGSAKLTDLLIEDTVVGGDGLAEGVHVFGGSVQWVGVESRGNGGAGLLVENGSVQVEGGGVFANGEPGVVMVGGVETSAFMDFVSSANASAGFLLIESDVTLTNVTAETNRLGPDGAGDGVATVVSATLTVRGGQFRSNASNGLFVLGGSEADIAGSEFVGNAGFGIAGCGNAVVVESGENTFRNNTRGDRQACN